VDVDKEEEYTASGMEEHVDMDALKGAVLVAVLVAVVDKEEGMSMI
jgi:hypothetical protein